jgi:hypothetical protein
MNRELELQLVNKYPKILRDHGGNPMETCMAWGIETDDGWFELLDKCMEKLQYFCDLSTNSGNPVQIIASQIKEKYGTLSFYYGGEGGTKTDWDIIDDIISETERRSAQVCETSGKHGCLCYRGSWYKTLSYEEARKLGYKASNQDTEDYWVSKDVKKQNGELPDDE